MQVSRNGRLLAGALVALLVCQSSMVLAGTVAYWRFEEGPADAKVAHTTGNGVFEAAIADSSGNGNALSAWSYADWANQAYRANVPASTVTSTGASNTYSVGNTGDYPGLFTGSDAMRTMTPAAFTIEASFNPNDRDGHRTIVGRESRGTASINADLAALYFQTTPNWGVAIKFCDVTGVWHEALSDPNVIQASTWYNMAAVSDGSTLSLYLDSGEGYKLVADADMTISGSADTSLNAGATGAGMDSTSVPGAWTVGRGMYAGGHTDRPVGLVDEVRISDSALSVNEFLFAPEPGSLVALALFGVLAFGRRRASK